LAHHWSGDARRQLGWPP